jgi:serine/threonine protein kinase
MAAVEHQNSFCGKKLENGILCGGFGCVVKVEDTDTKQYYAGKISVGEVDSISKLESEYEILKKLNNDKNENHIIQLKRKEDGEIEDLCNITLDTDYYLQNEKGEILKHLTTGSEYKMMVMEYLSGGDLFDYVLQKRQITIEEIRRIFMQIIDAVEFCHANKVYHFDIKLDNFVFTDQTHSTLKMIDFGLAKQGDDICNSRQYPIGTAGYFAPELFSGKEIGKEISCSKCDIFSIGIVLLMMIRHQIVTDSKLGLNLYLKNDYETYVKRLRESITLSTIITDELKILLLYIITIDPNTRYSIEKIKESDWYKGTKLSESELEQLNECNDMVGRHVAEQAQKGVKNPGCIIS